MPFPSVVETTHLTLRRPTAADRDAWVRLHRDERTYWHAPHAMHRTDDAAADFLGATLAHWDERGFGFWLAEDKGTGEVVGVCGVKVMDDAFLNLYYRLTFDRLGQGLGREMSRASASHAIEFLPELPIRALVKEINTPSVRTALATGFVRVGTKVLHDDLPDEPPSTVFEAPRVEVRTEFDDATRESILDLWTAVNDAGGAVGFTPGAPRERVAEALAGHEAEMAAGRSTAVLLRAADDGRLVAMGWYQRLATPLMWHTATVYRVMSDPELRGRNLGHLLMSALHGAARRDGVEVLSLGVRSGYGTARFYEDVGYAETGRVLGAIRVAPGDDRDDITMSRRLDDRSLEPDTRN